MERMALTATVRSRGVRCRDLLGHTASVSAVAAVSPSRAVSASYDKSIRCWAVATGKEMAALHGHKAPVLHIAVADDFLVSAAAFAVAAALLSPLLTTAAAALDSLLGAAR